MAATEEALDGAARRGDGSGDGASGPLGQFRTSPDSGAELDRDDEPPQGKRQRMNSIRGVSVRKSSRSDLVGFRSDSAGRHWSCRVTDYLTAGGAPRPLLLPSDAAGVGDPGPLDSLGLVQEGVNMEMAVRSRD